MKNLQDLCLRCERVKKQFDGLNAIDILSMLSVMIDYTAFLLGVSTEELMQMITPVITDVNAVEGPIFPEFMLEQEDK